MRAYKKSQALRMAENLKTRMKQDQRIVIEYDWSQRTYILHILDKGDSQRFIAGKIIKTLTK